jgi:hypothetical protein
LVFSFVPYDTPYVFDQSRYAELSGGVPCEEMSTLQAYHQRYIADQSVDNATLLGAAVTRMWSWLGERHPRGGDTRNIAGVGDLCASLEQELRHIEQSAGLATSQ